MTQKEIDDRAKYKKKFDSVLPRWKDKKKREIQKRIENAKMAGQPTAELEQEMQSLLAYNPDSNDVYGIRGDWGWGIANGNDSEGDIVRSLDGLFSQSGFGVEGSVVGDWGSTANKPGATAIPQTKGTRLNEKYLDDEPEPEPAPEPTPTPAAAKPAATAGGGQTGRVTAAMKPAEFKPKYLEEIEPKSEEEYLGKDPNNWKTMSKAEKAAKAIGFIGDIGGDVIDTIAAGYGLENGGAKRLREAREKLQRDKEERQAQYRDYVNKIEAENRRIREFNAGIGNQLAFQQFQAENEYNRQMNLLNEQARLQRQNGLYNTPL